MLAGRFQLGKHRIQGIEPRSERESPVIERVSAAALMSVRSGHLGEMVRLTVAEEALGPRLGGPFSSPAVAERRGSELNVENS
jgi:hypothetical protein